ncbi:MAG: peptidoglycan DD-metalloendopeptidase family protein [Cyanobacteriota bacterium]
MTQNRNTTSAKNSATKADSVRHSLSVVLGLGILGSTGILPSTVAIAQTTDSAEVVPSAQELLSPHPSPAVLETPSPARIPRLNRETTPAPQAPTAQPAPLPQPVVERPTPERSPSPVQPRATGASDSASEAPVRAERPPAASQPSLNPQDYTNVFIDDTAQYDLGSTRSGQAPVVLSERSTGCQVVLQPGAGVPNSVCAPGVGAGVTTAQIDPETGKPIAGTEAIAPGAVPGAVSASAPAGGGRALSLSVASLQSFYNRTIRPLALRGNGNTSLMFPLSIPAAISSAFGWRVHPVTGDARFHYGTDLAAPTGTPVLAAFSGRVETADYLRGYGLTVVLNHNGGREQTLYAHMSELFVRPGQTVEQGEVIGRVGSTGLSTGPHLHFEFRELTPQGWVALDAGLVLQTALNNLFNGVQLALAAPETKVEKSESEFSVKGLQDFGKLAERATPQVEAATEPSAADAQAALPTVTVPKQAPAAE